MSRRSLWLLGIAAFALLAFNLWLWPNYELERSATSLGVEGRGYKAAYDLLSELGFAVTRSYARVGRLPTDDTLWLVFPSFLHRAGTGADVDAQELLEWIDSGGTALVFGEPGSEWSRLELPDSAPTGGSGVPVEGDLVAAGRHIAPSRSVGFVAVPSSPEGSRIVLRAGETPFAIEKRIGAGRLVALADGRFLANANLARGDESLLLVDLVRGYGAPVFDEHCHGLAAPVSLVATLAASRAILPIAVALLAGLLWIGEQRSWPERLLADERECPEASIGAFVESLGVLYARSGDPQAVFRAYRGGFLRRLARQISPRAELAEQRLVERLERDRSLSDETRRRLVDGVPPGSEDELLVAVRAIECYPRIGS